MDLESDDGVLVSRSSVGVLIRKLATMCKKPSIESELSGVLDEYLGKLQESQVYLNNGIFTTNFAEAALLIQNAAIVYGKKIDLLWDELLEYQKRMLSYDKKTTQNKIAEDKLIERRQRFKRKKIQESENHGAKNVNADVFENEIELIAGRLDDTALVREDLSLERDEKLMRRHDVIFSQHLPKQTSLQHFETYTREAFINTSYEVHCNSEYLCNHNQFMADRMLLQISERARETAYNLVGRRDVEVIGYDVRDGILQAFLVEKGVTDLQIDEDTCREVNAYIRSFIETQRQKHPDWVEQHKKSCLRRSSILLTRLPEDIIQNYLKTDEAGDESTTADESTSQSETMSESDEEGIKLAKLKCSDSDGAPIPDCTLTPDSVRLPVCEDSGVTSQDAVPSETPCGDSGFFGTSLLDSMNECENDPLSQDSGVNHGDKELINEYENALIPDCTLTPDSVGLPVCENSGVTSQDAVPNKTPCGDSGFFGTSLLDSMNENENDPLSQDSGVNHGDKELINECENDPLNTLLLNAMDERRNDRLSNVRDVSPGDIVDDIVSLSFIVSVSNNTDNYDSGNEGDGGEPVASSTPKSALNFMERKCIIQERKTVQKPMAVKRKLSIREDETPKKKVQRRAIRFKWLKTVTTSLKKFEEFYYYNYEIEEDEGYRDRQIFSDSEEELESDEESAENVNNVVHNDHTYTIVLDDSVNRGDHTYCMVLEDDANNDPSDDQVLDTEPLQEDDLVPEPCETNSEPVPNLGPALEDSTSELVPVFVECAEPAESTESNEPLPDVPISDAEPTGQTGSTGFEIPTEPPEPPAAGCSKLPNAENNIEEYNRNFTKILKEKQAVQGRYFEWKTFIDEKLADSNKKEFDIHGYGTNILNSLPDGKPMKFGDFVQGKPSSEVVRYFIASLQLANTCNVELSHSKEVELANDKLELKLLSKQRYHENLGEYQAPSEENLPRKLARVRSLNFKTPSSSRVSALSSASASFRATQLPKRRRVDYR